MFVFVSVHKMQVHETLMLMSYIRQQINNAPAQTQ